MPSPNRQINIYPEDEMFNWIDSLPGTSRNSTVLTLLYFCKGLVEASPEIREGLEKALTPISTREQFLGGREGGGLSLLLGSLTGGSAEGPLTLSPYLPPENVPTTPFATFRPPTKPTLESPASTLGLSPLEALSSASSVSSASTPENRITNLETAVLSLAKNMDAVTQLLANFQKPSEIIKLTPRQEESPEYKITVRGEIENAISIAKSTNRPVEIEMNGYKFNLTGSSNTGEEYAQYLEVISKKQS